MPAWIFTSPNTPFPSQTSETPMTGIEGSVAVAPAMEYAYNAPANNPCKVPHVSAAPKAKAPKAAVPAKNPPDIIDLTGDDAGDASAQSGMASANTCQPQPQPQYAQASTSTSKILMPACLNNGQSSSEKMGNGPCPQPTPSTAPAPIRIFFTNDFEMPDRKNFGRLPMKDFKSFLRYEFPNGDPLSPYLSLLDFCKYGCLERYDVSNS